MSTGDSTLRDPFGHERPKRRRHLCRDCSILHISFMMIFSLLLLLGCTRNSSLAEGFSSRQVFRQCSSLKRESFLTTPRGRSSLSSTVETDAGPALEVISQQNWDLLSSRGKEALSKLILHDKSSGQNGQQHVYENWPDAGVDDEGKVQLAEQV